MMKKPNTWITRCTKPGNYYAKADSLIDDCSADYVMYQIAKTVRRAAQSTLKGITALSCERLHTEHLYLTIRFKHGYWMMEVSYKFYDNINTLEVTYIDNHRYPENAGINTLYELTRVNKDDVNDHILRLNATKRA